MGGEGGKERPSRKTKPSQTSIQGKSGAGQVPRLFQQRDQPKEHGNLRHKNHGAFQTSDDAVDDELTKQTFSGQWGHRLFSQGKEGFDPAHWNACHAEHAPEQGGHETKEDGRTQNSVARAPVQPVGPLGAGSHLDG